MDQSKASTPVMNVYNLQNDSVQQNTIASNPSTTGIAGLPEVDQSDLIHIVKILQKYNFKESEEIFKREIAKKVMSNGDSAQKEKDFYFDIYESLVKFVETAKETARGELAQVQYPIFLNFYLDMINKELSKLALEFFEKFSPIQSSDHMNDLKQLQFINTKEQLSRSDIKETFRHSSNKYNVKLSEESFRLLKDFVKMKNSKPLVDIIKENIMLEIYTGPLRDIQIGGLLGESNSNNNTTKIFYGLLKEPELNIIEENDESLVDGEESSEKPKRRKNRRDAMTNKKNRLDPNAPQISRVPLPELRDIDRQNRQQAARDYIKRARLGPDKLPSICFYTILNSYNIVNCSDISDDSTWLVLGLADSTVRVCSLSEKTKLKMIKPLQDLELLDKESDDILNLMFDETSGIDHRTLIGHSGPVYSVSFSPDKYYLVSGSEDSTVRLWCLLTFSCLISYKGHSGPVWDVKFGPYGHYFSSCGVDKTARIWSTDQYQSLRLYPDHSSDVECICFHPNCNYLATGSNDRSIRIFDLANLSENPQVRQYTGHKSAINVIKFSTCGRFLASGGSDATILIWDLNLSVIVAKFSSHKDAIFSLEFSRDNSVLASGGLDNTVKVWNFAKLVKEVEQSEDLSKFTSRTEAQYEIGSWKTKETPIIQLHFTRRNLLVGIGPYRHN